MLFERAVSAQLWGVWITVHREGGRTCWLRRSDGQPHAFEERINAIIMANVMRRLWSRSPGYVHYEARELESQ